MMVFLYIPGKNFDFCISRDNIIEWFGNAFILIDLVFVSVKDDKNYPKNLLQKSE